MRSVIEADAEHPHCEDYRNWLYNRFKDTVFKEGGNHWSEIKKKIDKRGPNRICVLEPILDAKLKADKPIRAVGLREEAMREKIKEFQEKGWIVPSQSHWVSRGFLVPKRGKRKWRLVIVYRYVITQLRGQSRNWYRDSSNLPPARHPNPDLSCHVCLLTQCDSFVK